MPEEAEMKKWFEEQWTSGAMMRPAAACLKLQSDLKGFLQRYPLRSTFDCPASGVCTAYILNAGDSDAMRPGSILGTKRMHETEGFALQNAPGPLGAGQAFQVHGIFMGQSSAGPTWYQLDNTGPDLMLTAKLTGCTFIARASGANVEVAHLQPHLEDGFELHERMKATPGQETYGRFRYDIDTRSINVMGTRRNGKWKIYVQKIEKHHLAVLSVHRLFPP